MNRRDLLRTIPLVAVSPALGLSRLAFAENAPLQQQQLSLTRRRDMMGDDLVYWSVMEANRQRGGRTITLRHPCRCGDNQWRVRNGVDSQYASEYNPGEYVEFTCVGCGYSFEEQS